ncbi:MAG: Multimodular transpeptidase-transglycosylase [uncultured Truepera sp.]|uniref:peptidoglycan glycosyltransferase n=1 Tax=uncultured Truepera sp. TaxID=543023 RepID=A0A6J4V9N6_9DEIN|nr:MAG: Multimodular transpeptidase-transglycosylase [uncultured Truepera sp.]
MVQGLFLLVLTVVLSVAALLGASAFKWASELPPVSAIEGLEYTATSQFFDASGQVIGTILPAAGTGGATTNRTVVTLDKVAPPVLWAIVSSEDDQFFQHYGFDTLALLRATYEEFLGGGGRGGSTLTTQVVKNTLLTDLASERSLERKFKEVMLAVELERRLTKAEILQQYLNVVYWGKNFYGIHAAAEAYFNKDPLELTLAEGLYLARLLPAPELNYEDFISTRRTIKVVLGNMVERGVVSQDAADRAWRQPLEPTGWRVRYNAVGETVGEPERTAEQPRVSTTVASDLNKHVAFAVRNEVERLFPGQLFRAGGLRIYTTIDSQAQEAANKAARDEDSHLPEGAQLALVSLDPATGGVLAMVGGRQGAAETGDSFNRATSARRQPGSSFKPIVVATALEEGGYTQASLIADTKTSFAQDGQPAWLPRNHDDAFDGLATLRSHLDRSRNIPMVKLVEAVTPQAVVTRASQLGYDDLRPVPAIALGSFEVTPLEHASALGAFANGGVHVEPHLIERVTDADGNVLFEAAPRRTEVWSETTAYLMLDMLRGNVVDRDPYGLSNRAQLSGRWVGGKTGTTNDERDIWFVGLTPETVSAVWIGYDEPRPIPEAMPNGEQIGSSRQPVWIWKRFAEEALAGKASRTLQAPRSVVFEKVNLSTGVPSAQGTRVAFARGTQPGAAGREVASYLNISVPIDTRTKTRASASTPREYLEWREISPNEVPRFAQPLPIGVDQPEGVQDGAQSSDAPTPALPGTEPDESADDEDGVGWLDWNN